VAATCTSKGSTKEFACSKCWTVLKRSTATPKLPHNWEIYEGTVTCTEEGHITYWKCKDCEQISIDNGATILRNTNKLNSDALGHDYGKWQKIDGATHKRICGHDELHIETDNHNFVGDICSDCSYDKHVCSPKLVMEKAATCKATGKKAYYKCDCGKCYEDATGTKKIATISSWGNISVKGHTKVYNKTVATTTGDGKEISKCSVCSEIFSTKTIDKIGSVKLSYTKVAYTGKAKIPSVTVKDSKGKVLVENTDYTVTYATGRTKVGRYKVTVKFKGNYSGTKTLYFTVVPNTPKSATGKLSTAKGGYNDVKFSWTASTGASGYMVYYKKASASKYTYYKSTTKTTLTKKNLTDGTKYNFKVVPYYKTSDGTKYYLSDQYKEVSVYTLKKISTPTLSKSGTQVKVKWTNIAGETGYQISRSTTKTGTNIVATYKTTKGTYKLLNVTKGKKCYYKVRAYKVVNGKKVYGPWSAVKAFKR